MHKKSAHQKNTEVTAGGIITAHGTAHGSHPESRRKVAWERKQVLEGKARQTSSGKVKSDLKRRPDGHIVTKAKSALAARQGHLAGYLGKISTIKRR